VENPGLVYCSITGYGQDGPDADLPGYDFLTQARGGLMSITGEADGPPVKVGVAVTDLVAGLYAATGILAALNRRRETGEGAYLDVSLLDCQFAALANVGANYLIGGAVPRRYGNAHPNIVPYQLFETADEPLVLAVGNDSQWRRAARLLGLDDLAEDARFRTNPDRVRNRDELCPIIQDRLRTASRAEWLDRFRSEDVPAGPVQTIDQVSTDAQLAQRGMIQPVEHAGAGRIALAANPLLRTETPGIPPPRLGEGGEEMAAAWLREP
jgi:formyl-CoA transferase